MHTIKFLFLVLIFSSLTTLLLSASNCQKQCQDQQDCQRICECSLPDVNQVQTCGLAYTCDTVSDLCSEEYDNNDCDKICNTYQPVGLCNSQQCETERDCNKESRCEITNTDGSRYSYTCTQQFACNTDYKICGAEYTLADFTSLCNYCAQNPGSQSNIQQIAAANSN